VPYDCCPEQPNQPPVPGHSSDMPLESSRLPMRGESAGVARRRVRETLRLFDAAPDVIDDAALLVSAVVTNGVVHAGACGSALKMFLIRADDRLLVEVHDPSRTVPYLVGPPDTLSESGRGLRIVEELAAAYGVRLTERSGKIVWFEVVAWPKALEGGDVA
jgi:anti-sigma regulatory factor (Ser/Thr protein kinase)